MKLTINQKYHLHHRAEFFVHRDMIDENTSLKEDLDQLFQKQQLKDIKIEIPEWNQKEIKKFASKNKIEKFKEFRQQCKQLNVLWMRQMMNEDKGLIEKMTLFWSGHFACKTDHSPYLTMELNNLIRRNALGNFRDLLYAVVKSASMIQYLHLKQNKKSSPNEDFARELCELFTLGRDVDYTEKDVGEIARAFTGWGTDQYGDYWFNEKQHDAGTKTIFGNDGPFKGEDVLEMILLNKKTAYFICGKLYRFFVSEEINESHVQELANVLYENNYDITISMKHLFSADWFYESQGKLIKSPVEFIVGLGKMLDLKFEHDRTLLRLEHYLGQVLFDPPNVAGWPGGRQWIDSSRLAMRLRLGSLIINRGVIEDELSAELDEMISKKQKKRELSFAEFVDWEKFWSRNEKAEIFDLLLRSENASLKESLNTKENKTVLQLLSTPDFQLI